MTGDRWWVDCGIERSWSKSSVIQDENKLCGHLLCSRETTVNHTALFKFIKGVSLVFLFSCRIMTTWGIRCAHQLAGGNRFPAHVYGKPAHFTSSMHSVLFVKYTSIKLEKQVKHSAYMWKEWLQYEFMLYDYNRFILLEVVKSFIHYISNSSNGNNFLTASFENKK